jgi:3-oxoacyl-[acyl-carrier-protein] synthase-3
MQIADAIREIQWDIKKPIKPIGILGVSVYYPKEVDVNALVSLSDILEGEADKLRQIMQEHAIITIQRTDGIQINETYQNIVKDLEKNPQLYREKTGVGPRKIIPRILSVSLPIDILKKISIEYSVKIDDYRQIVTGFDTLQKNRSLSIVSAEDLLARITGQKSNADISDNPRINLQKAISANLGTKYLHWKDLSGENLIDLMNNAYRFLSRVLGGLMPTKINDLVYATLTQFDPYTGGRGLLAQRIYGSKPIQVTKLHSGCNGAIDLFQQAVLLGNSNPSNEHILALTGDTKTEELSSNWVNRALFVDGATAQLMGTCQTTENLPYGLLGVFKTTIPCLYNSAIEDDMIKGNFRMDGSAIKTAVEGIYPTMVNEAIEEFGFDRSKVTIVSHQMNGAVLSGLAKILNSGKPENAVDIRQDQIVNYVHLYGNSVSSTIPTALYQLLIEDKLKVGDEILFLGIGVGFDVGFAGYRVNPELIDYGASLRKTLRAK